MRADINHFETRHNSLRDNDLDLGGIGLRGCQEINRKKMDPTFKMHCANKNSI